MTCIAIHARLLSLLTAAGLTLALAHVASADPNSSSSKKGPVAYRWVDEQGVVHYGDAIPPQYASKEKELLNGEGVEIGRVDGQKTPEQQATEERDHAALAKQKQHDAFLVTTYTSVKDIESLRDARLHELNGQRAAAEQYMDSLRVRLDSLQSRAMVFQPYSPRPDARRMPDDLAEGLVRTVNELRAQTTALASRNEEETALRAQFQSDIERYRQLHTIHSQ
jgi:Domain of unknown function (DUF4124)